MLWPVGHWRPCAAIDNKSKICVKHYDYLHMSHVGKAGIVLVMSVSASVCVHTKTGQKQLIRK